MRCLIRRVTGRGKENLEYSDSEVVAEEVTLGRAADETISLRGADVAVRHASIRLRRGGGVELRAQRDAAVRINDVEKESAVLQAGDVIEIGPHRLTVLPEQPGFDFGLQVEPGEDGARMPFADAAPAGATGAGPYSKARLAWYTSGAVLLLTFVLPLSGLFSAGVRDALRTYASLASDAVWDTGPLAPGHSVPEIGADCNVCHRKPFRRVENAACAECHKEARNHVPDTSPHAEEFAQRRCESCHKEHKEPTQIVSRVQGPCIDCHADADTMKEGGGELELVSDFGSSHPDFRLTMLVPQEEAGRPQWRTQRVSVAQAGLEERSNLKFDHKVHLDPKGVDAPAAPGGKKLMQCSDCHVMDAAGARMRPMTMEGQCSACHLLAFDEHAPEREVPHGKVEEVLASLEDYYSRLGLARQPDVRLADVRARVPRRPGKILGPVEPETVLAWAQQQARIAGEDLFERSVCATCHNVTRIEDEDARKLSWRVEPVKVNERWLPDARFSHRKHATAKCGDCHEAASSEKSTEVLMPGIEVCRDCHGGTRTIGKLSSRCVDCHGFHNPRMAPLVAASAAGAP